MTEAQKQQQRKENEERKQRRAAQQQNQIHVNVGSEANKIPMAIEDAVGNEDDGDRSIEGRRSQLPPGEREVQARSRQALSGYVQQLQPNVH